MAPNAAPPVVRIVDIGRYRYEQKKKAHSHSPPALKEVQFRPVIAEADFIFKRKHIAEFLAKGSRCRVCVRFRGREVAHIELGTRLIDRLIEELVEVGHLEGSVTRESKQISLVLAPGPSAPQTKVSES